MRFVDVPNLHGALGVSHRWFKHPLFQRSNGRLSSSLLLYQPYGPAWLEPKGPAVEARLHPVLWVDGSMGPVVCGKCSEVARIGLSWILTK